VIKVPLPSLGWQAAIAALNSTWWSRAQALTAQNRAAGAAVTPSGLWSEIKPLFVQIQREKCAYCERRLGSHAIEWDVEHFRPKAKVDAWPLLEDLVSVSDTHSDTGYFLLAYDPRNYLVSCKPCNSTYKRNYFPVVASRRVGDEDPIRLAGETPMLVNPLDPADSDPASILGFEGPLPIAIGTDEHSRNRGQVTARLLALGREDLVFERIKIFCRPALK
jgi:hypothetical protein